MTNKVILVSEQEIMAYVAYKLNGKKIIFKEHHAHAKKLLSKIKFSAL